MTTRVPAPWLDESNSTTLGRAIVRRALVDVGICEDPPGSNRSPRITEYLNAVGSPAGSPWCAAAVAAWWRECVVATPPLAGSCDSWMGWAKQTGRWTQDAQPGHAVVYGTPGDASHIGIVARVAPIAMTCEGNTSFGVFTREGVLVDLRPLNVPRVLGYVAPTPVRP